MNKRQRKRRLKQEKIDTSNLAPKVARGFTQGASLEEHIQETDNLSEKGSALDRARILAGADERIESDSGDRYAAFVAESDSRAVWTDGVTDRPQLDVHKTYTKKGMRMLREGRQCLRCDEPLDPAMPAQCPLCGYAVADRQIMDIAMEFEGEKHIGPSAPVSDYLAEQDARVEKRRFIKKVLDGGQGKIPSEWLRDAVLLEGLTPSDRAALAARR